MVANVTEMRQISPVNDSTETALNNWTMFRFANDTELDDVDPHEEVVRMIQLIENPPIIPDNDTEDDVDPTYEMRRMMMIITLPPITVLGTIGNLLTFITMQRGSLKHTSTCFYMAILGLADTGEFQMKGNL